MLYTTSEEIEIVRERIKVFSNHLPKLLVQKLLAPSLRSKQHPLFFSLLHDRTFQYLSQSVKAIKHYRGGKYCHLLISKLTKDSDTLNHWSNVAEIWVVGYYIYKFRKHRKIEVVWEGKLKPGSDHSVDLSIRGYQKTINIEVTSLYEDARIAKHMQFRHKIQEAIELTVAKLPNPRYSYTFSIPENSRFTIRHVKAFTRFIKKIRKLRIGNYDYVLYHKVAATIQVNLLNKLKYEYAAGPDIWSGWMKDNLRIRNKIVDKAKTQLTHGDINIICVPNFSGADRIDFEEAFLGKEQYTVNSKGQQIGFSRSRVPNKDAGAISIIGFEGYPTVHALVYFDIDYSKKEIINHPVCGIDRKQWDIIK